MSYVRLDNPGAPVADIKRLLPNVSNPANLPDGMLEAMGVARCVVIRPALEWWQTHGEPITDDTVRPVTITYPVLERPLSDVKSLAWERIKEEREVRQSGMMPYQFGEFTHHIEFTKQAKDDLNAQATAALILESFGSQATLVWTVHENVTHQLTPTEMKMLGVAAGLWQGGIHAQSQVIRDAIYAATSIEAVIAASVWPE